MKKLFTFIMLAFMLCHYTTLAQDIYNPIMLDANTLNANCVIGQNEELPSKDDPEIYFDSNAAFFCEGYDSQEGGLPASLEINNGNGENIPFSFTWTGTGNFDGNDAIRLNSSTPTVTLNFTTMESFKQLYVCTTAGDVPGSYSNIEATINYIDGASLSTSYPVYDWYDVTDYCYTQLRRYTYIDWGYGYNGSLNGGPVIFCISLNDALDPTRPIKSITFTQTSYGRMSTCVLALSGVKSDNVPKAPTYATCSFSGSNVQLTWDAVAEDLAGNHTTITKYVYDIATSEDFAEITVANQPFLNFTQSDGTCSAVISDITTTDGYLSSYIRIRAENVHGQSSSTPVEKSQGHSHNDIIFDPWTSDNSLPTEAGNYYLTQDVTLSSTWTVPSGVNLCLNGKVIKLNGEDAYISITNANFGLYDCSETVHQGYFDNTGLWCLDEGGSHTLGEGETAHPITGGVITGGVKYAIKTSGSSTVFNIQGGNIAGNKAADDSSAAIFCGGGTINMFGGGIVGNTKLFDNGYGGGVYLNSNSTFNMSGGEISYNRADVGGGVCVERNCAFNMSGGEMCHNIATKITWGEGGCIYSNSNSNLSITGSAKIMYNESSDCGSLFICGNTHIGGNVEIAYNTCPARGSGIYSSGTTTITDNVKLHHNGDNTCVYQSGGTMIISGNVEICNNPDGGVCLNNGKATIVGNVKIKENGKYGVYYFYYGRELTLGGNVQIEGNTNNSVSRNVWLYSDKYIIIADDDNAPQDGMSVGVTITSNGGLGQFTTNGTEDDVQYFFSDAAGKNVEFVTDHLELTQHVHDGIAFAPWTSDNSLPTEEGSYYLTKDVTLSTAESLNNEPNGTVSLCLNGKRITVTHRVTSADRYGTIYTVTDGNTLNLYDCDNTFHEGYVDDRWHPGIPPNPDAQVVGVYGGYTEFQNGDGFWDKCCIYVNGGTYNQYGGNLSGGCGSYMPGDPDYRSAGGITTLNGGICNLYGGTVVGCRANWSASGGNVYVMSNSTFNMYNGSAIKACGAADSGHGSIGVAGVFNMHGGEICDNIGKVNNAYKYVYIYGGTFNMYDGKIHDNELSYFDAWGNYGHCISVRNGSSFNMYGGEISDNLVTLGAVDYRYGYFTLGGSAVIKDNKDANNSSINKNVYLANGRYITIAEGDKAPQEGMSVGITMKNGTGRFTTNGTSSDTQYFFADGGGDTIVTCPSSYLVLHAHGNWQYIGHYDTLFLECGNQHCTEPRLVTDTLTLTAAAKVYDGNPYDEVSTDMTDDFLMDGYTLDTLYAKVTVDEEGRPINYEPTTPTAPTDAGNYVVRVYAIAHSRDGEGDRTVASNYAEAQFTILRADYSGYDNTADCTLGASQGSTASFQLPDIPTGAAYGDVTNYNNFTVAIDGSTVTLMTNAGGLPHTTEPITFTVTVNPDLNHNPYNITVTVTPEYPSGGESVEGVRYFYNAEAGKWLGVDNLSNGMRASLVDKPQPILVTDNGGYTYLLDAYIASSAGNGYLGLVSNECLMNCAEGAAVSFWPVSDNIYTVGDVNGHVFGYDGSGLLSANATGEGANWTLLTRDDLIRGLNVATLESPQDATFLINDPQCGKDNRLFDNWHDDDALEKAGSDGDTHASANNDATGKFNAYQDLERGDELDIPNGIYELSVQGFYSSTSDKKCAYFYANSETTALKDIASVEQQPATEADASAAFTAGEYQCSTIRFMVINHRIRIGVKGVYDECGWTAFDNFRLRYLGPIRRPHSH